MHHFQTSKPIVISRKGCIIVTSPGWLRSTSGLCGHELAHLSARWKWKHAVLNKENRDKSRWAQKSRGFTARFMVFWSTSLLFRASLMGQNGCFVLASFIALHYFSRTSAQIEPHRHGSDECEGRCWCASVHVCLDKCTFPVTPHLQKATTSPNELMKPSAGQLTWLPTWPAPPGSPFISLPPCWTQQEQLGTLLLSSPPSHLSQLYFPANYHVVRAPNAT